MGELILRYYLKVFSLTCIICFFLISLYIFNIFNKNILLADNYLIINKGEKLENILRNKILNFSNLEIVLINIYYRVDNITSNNFIHYGDFYIDKNISIIDLLEIIYKPSNVLNKITIFEGWSKNQLKEELSKYFDDYYDIPYENIIADTYFFEKNRDFDSFVKKLTKIKNNYFENFKNNKLYKVYTQDELMIIGSLIEKEALNNNDKGLIFSVIFNRLKNRMKLQIDATVLYSLTNGKYNLNRNLLISDLKTNHPYNTYIIRGLPPKPISYIGKKTLDIIFENYKSDFLFYFFNKSLNKHIFSKSYESHINKLNEYRKNK